jgi:hypothetical protein
LCHNYLPATSFTGFAPGAFYLGNRARAVAIKALRRFKQSVKEIKISNPPPGLTMTNIEAKAWTKDE